VSRANQTIAKKRRWKFYRVELTATGDGSAQDFEIGTAVYNMRPGGLAEVYVGAETEDAKYDIIDPQDYKYLVTQNSTVRLAYEWYDGANDKWMVHLSQVPDDTETIYYTIYYLPAKKTETSASVMSPDLDAIGRYTLAYIYEGEDEDKYQSELQMAEAIVSKYEADDDGTNIGQVSTFGNNNRGIGTY